MSVTKDTDMNGDPTLKSRSSFKDFVRVFAYAQPIDYLLGFVGVLGAVGSGVGFGLVQLVIGDFVTLITEFTAAGSPPTNFMSEVSKSALNFVYIGIGRFVGVYLYSSLLSYVALRITRNLQRRYLESALRQEVGYFDQSSGNSISMQATSNGRLIQVGISEKLGQVFQAVSTFVAAFIIAFVSQWKLTLILICIIPALFLIGIVAGGFDAQLETKVLKFYGQAGSFAETSLASIRTIKAFSLDPRLIREHSTILHEARTLGDRKNGIYCIMFGGEYFVVYAGMGLAFWQGIRMLVQGEVESIGKIFTVVFSIIIAGSMLNTIAPHIVTFSRAATAAGELFELIDKESGIDPFAETGEVPPTTMGSIELAGLGFSYPSRPNTRVLDDFTLSVPAGKVTALVGPSGSGKSTIIGLLERWYNPNAGTIRIDGKEIDKLNLGWLRTHMRLVQQEPVLFNGTVLENICHGLIGTPWENCSDMEKLARVESAAKLAYAHDFIQQLPDSYNTQIGERGGLLSGGQKQRIAIARSIISEPKMLLLDEATSALDPHAEGIVQKALNAASKNRTTIVIAHKLKTIQDADNIVVMQKGKIVEQGRHDDLVALGGAYSILVKAQDLSTNSQYEVSDESSQETESDAALELEPSKSRHSHHTDQEKSTPIDGRDDYGLHKGTGIFRTVTRLVKLVPEIRSWCILVGLTCIAGSGIYPGQAILLGRVTDVFNSGDIQGQGNYWSLMLFIMAICVGCVYGVLGWATNIVAQTFAEKLRREMFAAILRQDLRFFDRPENTVGALTSRIDSYAQSIFELMGFNISIITISLISVVTCSILSITHSWKLGLVGVCAALPPIILSGYARIRIEAKMNMDMDKRFSNSAAIASETVNAIRTISSLAIEKDVLRRYTLELDSAIRRSKTSLFTMMTWFALSQSIECFVLALGFWYGSKLVSEGQITFYQFFVSFMSVYFSGQGSAQLFSYVSSFTKANSAANYFFWIRNLEPLICQTDENKDQGPPSGCQSYSIDNIRFSYPLAPHNPVLKDVSLKIEPGQFVAFVGASGCGKSTMVSLLERFYDPTTGAVTIDNSAPLTQLNPLKYRAHVSLVQQEPTLFPGSIRENIAMGTDLIGDSMPEPVNDKMIEVACREANAWDFVSSLPDGLATHCGIGGSQLSGGQKQRIAIARALIRNPGVVLLDEATSALDTESERVVQAALMKSATFGNRITIAVAHRLSTVRDANCIFVFYGGRIVEAGSHSELIVKDGMYKEICEAQSLTFGL